MSTQLTPERVVEREAEQITEKPREPVKKMISIWFFVGALLAIYGVLILVAGLRGDAGDGRSIAMPGLHMQIWWGLGLLALGMVYIAYFRPRR